MKTYKERKHDIKRITSVMYALLERRSIEKQLPYLTKEDFINFARTSEPLKLLIDNWVAQDFQRKYSPTVDRIIPALGYTIENIQFITLSDNVIKGNAERTHNRGRGNNKRKIQLKKDCEIHIFESGKSACDFLNISRSRVSTALNKKTLLKGWSVSYV